MGLFNRFVTEEELQPPSGFEFEPGWYEATVEAFRFQALKQGEGGDFLLSENAQDGEALSIQVGELQPLEGQADPGARKFFLPSERDSFLLRNGERTWFMDNVELAQAGDNKLWNLVGTQRLLTGFAIAMGAVESDGNGGYDPVSNYPQLLQDEAFTGRRLRFRVQHRPWKSKAGKSGLSIEAVEFGVV